MLAVTRESSCSPRVEGSASVPLSRGSRSTVIPKIIHYFWFSGDPVPEPLQRCMDTWARVLPGYEIRKWDASTFDVGVNSFVAEAFAARRWAFVTDYARLHALHACGGVYLDTDVAVFKPLDEFLQARVFTAVEFHSKLVAQRDTLSLLDRQGRSLQPGTPKPGIGIQAAIIGGEAGHPFLRDCMRYYDERHFTQDDGSHYDRIIAPDIYALVAEGYGFRYVDEEQHLREGIRVLPSELLAGAERQKTERSYAVHYCAGGWRVPSRHNRLARRAREALQALGLRKLWHKYWDARARTP